MCLPDVILKTVLEKDQQEEVSGTGELEEGQDTLHERYYNV